MSSFDDYRPEESSHLQPGDYRVAIVDVEEATSKASGNPMIVVSVRPSGSIIKIKQYLVKNDYFNKNATQLFDSFGIERGNFDLLTWVGAVGGAKLKQDENGYLKVQWFLSQKQQESLPPWEGEAPIRQELSRIDDGNIFDEDLPF